MNTDALKPAGAEKFETSVKIDTNLDRKHGASSFPKKVALAKANLRKVKRK